ncbi:MAG: 4-alpha-glucanotransferase [Rhodobacteraceae bacterium]|nr:4-alpha-glucanotransferase [Paracoccaceae bacterium]
MTDWIADICAHLGVHARYRGYDGQMVEVARDTQVAVLHAMGYDVRSDSDARAYLLDMRSEEALRPLPADVIVTVGQPCVLVVSRPVDWQLAAEHTGGELARGKGERSLLLPALPLGIHRLRMRCEAGEFTTWVLARPVRAVRLDDRIAKPRIWGVLAALYGLTDGAAAQIGSYDLLGDYAVAMAGHGADFLGINPVHAMGHVRPDNVVSPYSPSHRAFLNTWYCGGTKGDGSELIDYPSALHANDRALAAQFTALPGGSADRQAYESFTAQAGHRLDEFALFEALAEVHGADWRDWPAQFRDRDAKALAGFAALHADAIARSKWAQWQADRLLSEAQSRARNAGMRVGLFLDLAVGPRLGGAETWAGDTSLITGATLGAPPDPLGPSGQSWGLAPLSPLRCRAEGYAGFARLLRQVMRHAGMIRIDHVLGLMRSFWIPEGRTEGTYVSYPFDALLAVIAIESVRNDTIVVGEDLGLVPDGLREKLATSGIYGLDVMQYMSSPTGGFVAPSQTREMAVCAFATHDTPTIAGFFAAGDARLRHRLGDIDTDKLNETRAKRKHLEDTLDASDPVAEIHNILAGAKASMVAIQLDDIAGRISQQNLPGTVDSYPNWRFKAPFSVQEIASSDAFAKLAETMRVQGRSNQKGMEKQDDLSDCSDRAH